MVGIVKQCFKWLSIATVQNNLKARHPKLYAHLKDVNDCIQGGTLNSCLVIRHSHQWDLNVDVYEHNGAALCLS